MMVRPDWKKTSCNPAEYNKKRCSRDMIAGSG